MSKQNKRTGENPRLLRTLLEIIDNQIRENNPPETKQTLDRLIQAGYSLDMARRMIAAVVLAEIVDVLKTEQPYNEVRFIEALNSLPELPE